MSRLQSLSTQTPVSRIPYPEAERRLLIRIDETETTFRVLDPIDGYKVLAAVLRREAGRRFVPVAKIFRSHLASGFVINADGSFF